MNSPFRAEKLEDLLYRQDTELLKNLFKQYERIWMYDSRGTGKTTLAKQALIEEQSIYIDCLKIHNYDTLLLELARQSLECIFPIQNTLANNSIDSIYEYFPDLKLSIQLKPHAQYVIDEKPQSFKSLIDSINQWSQNNNQKIFLVFDEFQELFELEKNEHQEIRQSLENSYVLFIGNKKETKNKYIMEELFSKTQAFYSNFAHFFFNPKINENEWVQYLSEHISLAKEIIYYAGNNIYLIIQLAHKAYILKSQSFDDLKLYLIQENKESFKSIFDSLSKNQKKTLLLIASAGQNIYKSENLQTFELSKSATERCLGSFIKNNIIFKEKRNISFSNPLFRDWLTENY